MWRSRPRSTEHKDKEPQRASATLTPAGKAVDVTAHDIHEALDAKEIGGRLIVKGCSFRDKIRVLEAIHDLAKKFGVSLRKER
jgi:hypothetical protein